MKGPLVVFLGHETDTMEKDGKEGESVPIFRSPIFFSHLPVFHFPVN
jgi:hypothetical protein